MVTFAVARPELPLPAGVVRVDPLRVASARFLGRLQELDAHAYAEAGLASPPWVLYDCAELPGALVGLALAAGDELLPVGMVAATPMAGEGSWLLYSLSSRDARLAPLPALVALALRVLAPRRASATAQWTGPELAAYASRGPLLLSAAWLPVHTVPATCAFQLLPAGAPVAGIARTFAPDDGTLLALQQDLEAGARVLVVTAAAGRVSIVVEGA